MIIEVPTFQEFMDRAKVFQLTDEQYLSRLGFSPEAFADFTDHTSEAFADLVTSGDFDQTLAQFRFAYEFRKGDTGFLETRRGLDQDKSLALTLDQSLQHLGFARHGIIPEDRVIDPDLVFKTSLLRAFPEVISAKRGIVSLATNIRDAGIPIQNADSSTLQRTIQSGMESYWDRTPVLLFEEFKKL